MARPLHVYFYYTRSINYVPLFFNRNEFRTTLILLNAIAAAAKIGLSKIPKNGYRAPAAIGTNAEL